MTRPHQPSIIPTNRRPKDDGTKYRLRDREGDPPTVWGDGLSYAEALKLRDKITFEKKSRSMTIEPMTEAELATHDLVADDLPIHDLAVPAHPVAAHAGTNYELVSAVQTVVQSDGLITKIPRDHQLIVNGTERPVPTTVRAGETVECRPLHADVAANRSAAAAAVAQVMQQHRRVPLDVTVRHPVPRKSPPPPDLTVSTKAPVVRLGDLPVTPPKPLPSPLKVATLEDGDVLPEGAITDSDLPDLAGDLGGGPSDADVEHARRQAEADRAG